MDESQLKRTTRSRLKRLPKRGRYAFDTMAEGSAKVRTGPPIDEEADCALPIRAGVVQILLIPVRSTSHPEA